MDSCCLCCHCLPLVLIVSQLIICVGNDTIHATYLTFSSSCVGLFLFRVKRVRVIFRLNLISHHLSPLDRQQTPSKALEKRTKRGCVRDQRVITTFTPTAITPQLCFILHSIKRNVAAEDLWHGHIWERQSWEGRQKEGNFRGSSTGAHMRFEGLILHAFWFFSFFFVQLTNMTCLTI